MSEERWIMASDGTPQMVYVGKTQLDDDAIEAIGKSGGFLVLNECRTMRTILIPNPEGGIIMQNQMVPAAICRGAATIRIKPVSYIWPDEDDATMGPLMDQIKKCSQSELQHRAKEAGLVTPDGMRVPSGGRLV